MNGSLPPTTLDQPASASAASPAGGGLSARAGGRGSPAPSSDAALPAAITSANRFRTTRYTNDQSKQPSLDHDKSAKPCEPDAPESHGRVCEPYALLPGGSRRFTRGGPSDPCDSRAAAHGSGAGRECTLGLALSAWARASRRGAEHLGSEVNAVVSKARTSGHSFFCQSRGDER